jgi:hypothetical protein
MCQAATTWANRCTPAGDGLAQGVPQVSDDARMAFALTNALKEIIDIFHLYPYITLHFKPHQHLHPSKKAVSQQESLVNPFDEYVVFA